MTSTFGYCKSDPDIPIAQLDYGYIGKCQDISKLQKILQILRSGEEGYYPPLEKFTEEQLAKKKPDSPLLEKVNKEPMVGDLSKDDTQIIIDELNDLSLSSKKNQTNKTKNRDIPTVPIPIRTSKEINSKNSKEKEQEAVAPQDVNKCKNATPRSYKEWEKMEKQLDNGDFDEICEEKNTNTDINKSPSSRPAHELLTQQKSSSLEDKTSENQYYAFLNEKNKGNEAFHCGDFKEALIYYNRSLDILPAAASYNNRAITLIKLGQFKEALVDCEKVISLEPSNIKAHLRRGLANKSLGYLEKASEDFAKVVELEPKNKRGKELFEKVSKELEKEQANQKKNGKRMKIKEINSNEEININNVSEISENEKNVPIKNGSISGISINENKDSINVEQSENSVLIESTETNITKQKSLDEVVFSGREKEPCSNNNENNDKSDSLDSSIDVNNDIANNKSVADGDRITNSMQQENEKTILATVKNNEKDIGADDSRIMNSEKHKNEKTVSATLNSNENDNGVDDSKIMNTEKQENEKTVSPMLKVNKEKDIGADDSRIMNTEKQENEETVPKMLINKENVTTDEVSATTDKVAINKQVECKVVYDLPANVIDMKNKGNVFYKSGRYDEASEMYTSCIHILLDDKSKFLEALATFFSNRSSCHMKIGNVKQCIHDCNKAIQFSPSPKAYLKRATAYESLEKYIDAYVDFQNVVQLDSSNVSALQAFSRLGNVLRAEYGSSWREKLHKTDPISPHTISTNTNINKNTSVIAEDEQKCVVSNNEVKSSILLNNPSVDISNQNITQKMEASVPKISEISSKETAIKGTDNSKERDCKQSVDVPNTENMDNKSTQNEYNSQLNDKASKLPEDVKHTSKPVHSNNKEKKATGTTESGNEKIQKYRLFLDTKDKGNQCVQQGKYADAVKLYTECINLLPDEVTSYTNRALCLLKLKQHKKAIDDCSHALTLQPDNVKALFRRAQARKMIKAYKEALVDLTRVLKLEPSNNAAKNEMDQCKKEFRTALRNIQATNEAAKQSESSGRSRKVPIEEILSEAVEIPIKGKLTTKVGKCPLAKDNPAKDNPVKDNPAKVSQSKKMSGFEFLHAWNNIKSNKTTDYANLLTQIDFIKLPEIISNKLDGEVLKNFIRTVNEQYTGKETYKQGIRLLKFLCRVPRFDTMVMFLNTTEKTLMRSTVDLLENRVKQSNEKTLLCDISSLRLSYR